MIILTDVDDVLLDYSNGFQNHYYVQQANRVATTFSEAYNIDPEVEKRMVIDFSVHSSFGNLKPVSGAVEAVKQLSSMGVRFIAISACGDDPRTLALRKQNLSNVFGDSFIDIKTVPLWTGKEEHLSLFKDSNMLWLEDNVNNYWAGDVLGLHSVLIKTKWNRPTDDMRVMNDWRELYNYILKNKVS